MRERNLEKVADLPQFKYSSSWEATDGTADEGLHTITTPDGEIDFIYTPGESDRLLVVFPGAVGPSMNKYPFFQGRPLARDTGAALLSFSDPGLAIAKRVFTTWMAGTWGQGFYRYLPSIIERFADGRRVLLTGVSAGGLPALHLNALIKDSISLVGIPRTSILSPPSSFYATRGVLFPNRSIPEINDALPLFPQPPRNPVVYAQNVKDDQYLAASCVPYMQKYADTGLVYTKMGDWGQGHKPMPRSQYVQSCKVLLKHEPFPKAEIDLGLRRLSTFEDFQEQIAQEIAKSRETQ